MDRDSQLANITARLEILERQNRRLKKLTATCLLIVGAGLALGAAGQSAQGIASQGASVDVQRARQFVVVDASGRTVATLGVDTEGMPGLSIKDPASGKERAWLGLWAKSTESGLGVFDNNEKERLWMGVNSQDIVTLNVIDVAGKIRAQFGQGDSGREAGVGIFDADAKERAWLGLADARTPRVMLFDANHRVTWSSN